MAGDPTRVDLFAEDRAHEDFLRAAIERLAALVDLAVTIAVRSNRGGHAHVVRGLEDYQLLVKKEAIRRPDVLVAAVDGNCHAAEMRKEIEGLLVRPLWNQIVIACPDPHIERWYLADGESFGNVVGAVPELKPWKCDRHEYKRQLVEAVRNSGQIPTLGGVEFARELAFALDPYRAGKTDAAFHRFWEDALAAFRTLKRSAQAIA